MTIRTRDAGELSIDELRSRFRGRVIGPGDADYDATRTVMYGGIDRHPRGIVRVADAEEVSGVVSLARETGFELAIRGGGHSVAGHSVSEGGIVLDLRDLTAIDLDAEAGTAWADAGLTARAVSTAAAARGLAIGFGDTGSVGIGGITLGGGVGYLSRKHGLTIDSLLAAEIVTADGQLRRVDAQTHPDLFWAIRGGGGNFGVATRFKYQLHQLDGFVGGLLVLPATPDTVAGFIAAAEAAPDELSTIANVMNCPPMPFLPENVVGQVVILAMLAYAGLPANGERAIAPFRALATPLADLVHPMSYPEMFPPDDPSYHPTAIGRTMFMDTIDRAMAETIVRTLTESDASLRVAQLRVLGGAVARVPGDATAFAHRSSRIMVNVAAFYDGASDKGVREKWVTEFAATLHQGDDGAYVNFLDDEGEARVRAAYPGSTWDRLAEIKRRYDPANLFRLNQNIPPGTPAT
jgi:FAD binding domain/Berberine and berberine like